MWRDDEKRTHSPWYKPLEDQEQIDAVVHWVLSRPGIFLNSVGDPHLLPKVLDAAQRFESHWSQNDLENAVAEIEVEPIFT